MFEGTHSEFYRGLRRMTRTMDSSPWFRPRPLCFWIGLTRVLICDGMQGDTKCGHVNVAKDGPPHIVCYHVKLILAKGQV